MLPKALVKVDSLLMELLDNVNGIMEVENAIRESLVPIYNARYSSF